MEENLSLLVFDEIQQHLKSIKNKIKHLIVKKQYILIFIKYRHLIITLLKLILTSQAHKIYIFV